MSSTRVTDFKSFLAALEEASASYPQRAPVVACVDLDGCLVRFPVRRSFALSEPWYQLMRCGACLADTKWPLEKALARAAKWLGPAADALQDGELASLLNEIADRFGRAQPGAVKRQHAATEALRHRAVEELSDPEAPRLLRGLNARRDCHTFVNTSRGTDSEARTMRTLSGMGLGPDSGAFAGYRFKHPDARTNKGQVAVDEALRVARGLPPGVPVVVGMIDDREDYLEQVRAAVRAHTDRDRPLHAVLCRFDDGVHDELRAFAASHGRGLRAALAASIPK